MKIIIPTRGRPFRQATLRALPSPWRQRTTLLTVPADVDALRGEFPAVTIVSRPATVTNVGQARQWACDHLADGGPLLFLDDDLTFGVRRQDHPGRFLSAGPDDIAEAFERMTHLVADYPMVGLAAREGGNRLSERPIYENTRIFRVYAVAPAVLAAEGIRFDVFPLMEDFHVALSLLRAGYRTAVVATHIHGQATSNAPGGCSSYRTAALQAETAQRFAAHHHPFVRLTQRATKNWGGALDSRVDVVISWAQAYAVGAAARSAAPLATQGDLSL